MVRPLHVHTTFGKMLLPCMALLLLKLSTYFHVHSVLVVVHIIMNKIVSDLQYWAFIYVRSSPGVVEICIIYCPLRGLNLVC